MIQMEYLLGNGFLELQHYPPAYIHEPWTITPLEKACLPDLNGLAYPNPIVDIALAASVARKKIWSYRESLLVKQENQRILKNIPIAQFNMDGYNE